MDRKYIYSNLNIDTQYYYNSSNISRPTSRPLQSTGIGYCTQFGTPIRPLLPPSYEVATGRLTVQTEPTGRQTFQPEATGSQTFQTEATGSQTPFDNAVKGLEVPKFKADNHRTESVIKRSNEFTDPISPYRTLQRDLHFNPYLRRESVLINNGITPGSSNLDEIVNLSSAGGSGSNPNRSGQQSSLNSNNSSRISFPVHTENGRNINFTYPEPRQQPPQPNIGLSTGICERKNTNQHSEVTEVPTPVSSFQQIESIIGVFDKSDVIIDQTGYLPMQKTPLNLTVRNCDNSAGSVLRSSGEVLPNQLTCSLNHEIYRYRQYRLGNKLIIVIQI